MTVKGDSHCDVDLDAVLGFHRDCTEMCPVEQVLIQLNQISPCLINVNWFSEFILKTWQCIWNKECKIIWKIKSLAWIKCYPYFNVYFCSRIFRCTLTKVPETNSLLQKSRLPLGILIHPFKDLNVSVSLQSHFSLWTNFLEWKQTYMWTFWW